MAVRRRIEEEDESGRRRVIEEVIDDQGRTMRKVTEDSAPSDGRGFGDFEETGSDREPRRAGYAVGRVLTALATLVALVLAIVEVLLGFRLWISLAGSGVSSEVVSSLLGLTGPLVTPFQGIAADRAVNGGLLEMATAIAMVVYLIVGLLLAMILRAAGHIPSDHRHPRTQRRFR